VPPPTEQCYVEIDNALESYYKRKFGIILDPKTQVLPVLEALQGHPEAGALWEKIITKILDDMGFKPTTHERNLYRGTIAARLNWCADRSMTLRSDAEGPTSPND